MVKKYCLLDNFKRENKNCKLVICENNESFVFQNGPLHIQFSRIQEIMMNFCGAFLSLGRKF